jgi:hypothetical protein
MGSILCEVSDEHAIPAAHIGVDLDDVRKRYPAEADEIARLDALMQRGDETEDQFLTLVELLVRVGAVRDAEYLLRRNIPDGKVDVYTRLFGTAVPDAFARAIEAWSKQFDVELTHVRTKDFLEEVYIAQTGEITFDHAERDAIMADTDAGLFRFDGERWISAE